MSMEVHSRRHAATGSASDESHAATELGACTRSWQELCPSWYGAGLAEPYDEVLRCDGQFREAYHSLMPALQHIEARRKTAFEKVSRAAFKGEYSVYHVPRMLTQDESTVLVAGVAQRGRALRALLQDVHRSGFGRRSAQPSPLPAGLLKRLMARSAERKACKLLSRPGDKHTDAYLDVESLYWSVWYGPDVIKGPDGAWYVVEDNLVYVGGFGDLLRSRKTLDSSFPELSHALAKDQRPDAFFAAMAHHYKSQLADGEVAVLLYYPRWMADDKEEQRVVKLFAKHGVPSVPLPTPHRRSSAGHSSNPHLEIRSDGCVMLCTPAKGAHLAREERVGLVILDMEASDADPGHSSVRARSALEEARDRLEEYSRLELQQQAKASEHLKLGNSKKGERAEEKAKSLGSQIRNLQDAIEAGQHEGQYKALVRCLKEDNKQSWKEVLKVGIPGLLDSYYSGRVKVSNGPGFEIIGDKELCMHVESLVTHYLDEQPILRTIPTHSFTSSSDGTPNQELIRTVFGDPLGQSDVVVRRVDGRGGGAVWVGCKLSRDQFLEAHPLVKREPQAFIAQRYTALSLVDEHLVDLRLPSMLTSTSEEVVVSPVFWGRGVPSDSSNGKVNISDHGVEFVVCTAAGAHGDDPARLGQLHLHSQVQDGVQVLADPKSSLPIDHRRLRHGRSRM